MADNTLYIRVLVRAAKLLGGVEALARHLGVSQTRLRLYLQDGEQIPEALFLRVVDVLVDDEMGKLGKETPPRVAAKKRSKGTWIGK